MRGGKRSGAGRPKGAKSERTKQREALSERALADGMTPLEFLLGAMRDEQKGFDVRLEAAKAAAPYVHPRLSNIEANVQVTGHEAALDELE